MEIKSKETREKMLLSLTNSTVAEIISDIEHMLDMNYGDTIKVDLSKHSDKIVLFVKQAYEDKGYTVTRNCGNDQRDGHWDDLEIS